MAHEPEPSDELFVPVDAASDSPPAKTGLSAPRYFPLPTATTPDGLLCVGGRLTPEWLIDAYSHGIFPWPIWEHEPMVWWSPDPRAIIELDGLHISRRLRRTLRSGKFMVTFNRDFGGVIRGCATGPGRGPGNTWLTPSMIDAYCRMHDLGHAHSVEVWCNLPLPEGQGMHLVGGTYGVAIGGLFAAESMFHRVRDASNVAVAHLVLHLQARGYQLLDIQQWTPHTGHLGAKEILRLDYLRRLAVATSSSVTFGPPAGMK
jgi:leucyl/phenylalanyl-tRNA---protein transferase